MKNGIDVSRWQGNIDWSAVKKSGVEFAIIKAGGADDGYYTDSCFEKNYTGARAAGLGVGAYYFTSSKFTTAKQGELEAKKFLNIIKGKTFDYPVYVDVEAVSAADKSGATEATIAFCEFMENNGYFVGIYASDISGFKDRLELDKLTAYSKWVARYGSEPQYVTSYDVWQNSDSGNVSGISGNVDTDFCYKDFPKIIKEARLNGYKEVETISKTESVPKYAAGEVKPTAEKPAEPQCVTYTVKSGDTLWGLAQKYGTTVMKIAQDNAIVNPDKIYVGQKITIQK